MPKDACPSCGARVEMQRTPQTLRPYCPECKRVHEDRADDYARLRAW